MSSSITSSASKLVLLYIVGILGIMSLVAGIYSVITGNFSEAAKEIISMFGTAITFVMGFYFNYKGESKKEISSETDDTSLPYAGK